MLKKDFMIIKTKKCLSYNTVQIFADSVVPDIDGYKMLTLIKNKRMN